MAAEGIDVADVVVVGAGPVGLLLACDLRRAGVDVVVLDRLPAPTGESRATLLDARSAGQLLDRGLGPALGELPEMQRTHFGGVPLDLGEDLANRYCPQARLEAALGARLVELGPPVRRGRAVTGLTADPDAVELELEGGGAVRTRWCVGCDGQDGDVRRLGGFATDEHPATRSMIRADVVGADLPDRRLVRFPAGVATSARRPDGSVRLMVHAFGDGGRDVPPTPDEVVATWRAVTGDDLIGATVTWADRFGDGTRLARSYRRGQVLLAGDAAHAYPPVGGQALNVGLADATALAGPLAARVSGRAGAAALDRWASERHDAGARALRTVRAQTPLLFGERNPGPLRDLVAELVALEPARRHLARHLSGTDVEPPPDIPGSTHRNARPSGRDPHRPHERSTTMGRLTGRTALVTGSSRGIGQATAVRLARDGALVAVHYATGAAGAADTVALIEGEGGSAFAVGADLGTEGAVHQLFVTLEQELKERTGETTLDVLVNNAAATSSTGTILEDVTPEDFDEQFRINTKAAFFVVQRAVPQMPRGGRIVNMSSALTRCAAPDQVVYAMTKGAVEQMTLHLARHLAPRGISINSVGPGITNNGKPVFDDAGIVAQMAEFSAFKRVGEADEVADVVAFLASPDARWVTGSFVDASGGTLLG